MAGSLWLVKANDLHLFTEYGGDASFLTSDPGSWKAYPPSYPYDGNPVAQPAAIYSSYWGAGGLYHAFGSGTLPGPYRWIVWDMEKWDLTSEYEQSHWAYYTRLAATLIHSHGMKMIAAPGKDLFGGWSEYLAANAAGISARHADVLSIQSQGVSRYKYFTSQAASQARSANPGVLLLGGLSTCPGGNAQTVSDLTNEYNSVYPSVVSGFWLNVGVWLSKCTITSQIRTASGFLAAIA
jgi:hypothetical protein